MLKKEEKTDEIPRKVGSYTLAETLGSGGYSWVEKGVNETSNGVVAMKFITREAMKFSKSQAK